MRVRAECANEPRKKPLCAIVRVTARRSRTSGECTVSDNVLEPGPQDYDRINVLVEAELVYWTAQFGVTRARLAQAIAEVGPAIVDLRGVLGNPAP